MTTKQHTTGSAPRTLHRGTQVQPSPYHGGSGAPKGRVHDGVAPGVYGLHGGTALPMGKLSGKKK
jgi:hypothetical protein